MLKLKDYQRMYTEKFEEITEELSHTLFVNGQELYDFLQDFLQNTLDDLEDRYEDITQLDI